MSGYKTFALAGAGHFGRIIIDELNKLKTAGKIEPIKVLLREGSKDSTLPNVQVHTVSYDDPSTLTTALHGVDVLISVLNVGGLDQQTVLADAAKVAGVKLFVPSEFGVNTADVDASAPVVRNKLAVQTHASKLGLPYVLFQTGLFADYIFVPPLGWDLQNGKVRINGDGTALVSLTARTDIARFLGHVLTSLPPSELENRIFKIEGDRTSFGDIAKGCQAKTGKTLEITHVPASELEAKWKASSDDFLAWIALQWGTIGTVVTKDKADLDNGVWPEWRPKKVLDVLG